MTGTVVEARPLRGLTLWQPWASAVAELGKDVENRGRRTTYRGLVLIHAGLKVDQRAMWQMPSDLAMPTKAVLAIARLTGAHTDCDGRCSQWAEPGSWHWQLADVLALTEPVPVPGAQGLWVPDHDLRRRVTAALPADVHEDVAAVLRNRDAKPARTSHPQRSIRP